MNSTNLWTDNDLGKYLTLFRCAEQARKQKIQLTRTRIESGYYLTDQVARATASKMLTFPSCTLQPR